VTCLVDCALGSRYSAEGLNLRRSYHSRPKKTPPLGGYTCEVGLIPMVMN